MYARRGASELVDIMVKAPSHSYKLAMCGMGALMNQIREGDKANSGHTQTTVQPKLKKRTCGTVEEERGAMAKLDQTRGKKARTTKGHRAQKACKKCTSHGINNVSHQSNNSNCPFFLCTCATCTGNPSSLCNCLGCQRVHGVVYQAVPNVTPTRPPSNV